LKAQKFMPLVLIVAGLLAYHNSFTGPFIFDDAPSIRENPTIRHLWPIWRPLSPPRWATVDGRPIVNLSLAINYALGGLDVRGYHVLNLTIHILAGLTLFGIVRRTLLQPRLRERFGAVANELALAVAVLWTVHPLQTESVTYVIQRCESLMGLFCLLTLYCFIRGAESPRPHVWYGLCLTACALGMASKEVMVAAPLIVLLYDWVFVASSFRELWRRRAALYVGLAATWLILAVLVVTTPHANTGLGIRGLTPWDYLKTEAGVIVYYLRLCFWPHPLVIDYFDWPIARSLKDGLVPGIVVAGLLGATAWAFRHRPRLAFLGACFFLILAPTSSILPSLGEVAAERRMYLPLAAVVTMVVIGIHAWAGRQSLPVFLGLAVGLGFLTVQRNQDYRSEIAIWADTVAKRPENPRAHSNLGNPLLDAGREREALEHYEQALRIKPDYALAHYDLGLMLWRAGKTREAVEHWEQALRLEPDLAAAHYTLGVALIQAGQTNEAMQHWEQTVRIDPDDAEAHNDLGSALLIAGRIPEAIKHYEQALRIRPDYAEAHRNLGLALEQMGRIEAATGHL
jgi:Flp pilus assembly protein TadD